MPIHVYACTGGCGQIIEFITKTASAPSPAQIKKECPRCKTTSAFAKTISAPAIRTATTTAVARRNDYRRSKPNAAENIMAGKTADGRSLQRSRSPIGEVRTRSGRGDWKNRKKDAVKPYLVEHSEEKWGEAITSNYGHVEKPKESEAVKEYRERLPVAK